MIIRVPRNDQFYFGGQPRNQVFARPGLYPDAWPFSKTTQGQGPVSYVTLDGINSTLNTTTADLWDQNTVRTLPVAGFTLAISSSAAADAAAGTGMRTVEVDVLDTDYKAYTLTMTLNGQTAVVDTTLVGKVLRVNDIRGKSWGTGLANAGAVYAFDSTDTVTGGVPQTATKIFNRISIGQNVAHSAFYTVPAGYQAEILGFRAGLSDASTTNRNAYMQLQFGPFGVFTTYRIGSAFSISSGNAEVKWDLPIVVAEKHEIRLQGNASGAIVFVSYLDLILYPTR